MKSARKFYDLDKTERAEAVSLIQRELLNGLRKKKFSGIISFFDDADTYIRKGAYLSAGRIFFEEHGLQADIIKLLENLLTHKSFRVRQTALNAAGEIAKADFRAVEHLFDEGLFDEHHSPRNAVIGSIKKAGEVNPKPVLKWAEKYLHHPDIEVRREICHGLELLGRKYPGDILPLLKQLQHDKAPRVRNTLVHVIGQISYKEGCLAIVVKDLKKWDNLKLVEDALREIIDVHDRYKNFAAMTQKQAKVYIKGNFKQLNTL